MDREAWWTTFHRVAKSWTTLKGLRPVLYHLATREAPTIYIYITHILIYTKTVLDSIALNSLDVETPKCLSAEEMNKLCYSHKIFTIKVNMLHLYILK